MKLITIQLILFILIQDCFGQIPIEQYETEIKNLGTEDEIEGYWNKLHDIDQNILLREKDVIKSDSISIDLMIRTTLLFQLHDTIGYNQFGNIQPVLNLSHSFLGYCQVIYWPIIEKCAALGGVIDDLGGKFPAYELESVSLSFYNYSLFRQEPKYLNLLNLLQGKDIDSIVPQLVTIFKNQKDIYNLSERKVIGSWIDQPFKNLKEDSSFEIIEMTDGNYYIKQKQRRQKLIKTKLKHGICIYRIEKEPFGWVYRLDSHGKLVLLDEKGKTLIRYMKSKNPNTK
jgi:hypothetical protein